ncbi:MAG: MFS transporter [Chloroflexi bacterium]|nr:MFS transporter [Chloroflexota bacterium]
MSPKNWTLLAVVLGSSIVFLDGTIVNVALPRIGKELPATVVGVLEGQTYVNSGYLAVLSALLILSGALNDYYGRRRMFAIGLTGFGITSVMCGLSPTMEILILCRLLQGAAGALLVPGALSIITATFQGAERGRAFGVWAAASSATTTLGPIVGGFLVDTVSWRLAFLINVPLVGLALFATIRHMRETRDEEATGRFDWLGAAVIALAVGGLAFGATRGQEQAWRDPIAFVSLGIGFVALAVFPVLMARSRNPLVPLDLFRVRNFAVTNLSTFLVYGALYVSFAFQGLFLQNTLGYSALAAGAGGLPVGIMLATLSPRFGALAGRFGARRFLAAAPVLMAMGVLWYARIPSTSVPWQANVADPATFIPSAGYLVDILPGSLLFGFGLTMLVAPLTTAVMASVPVQRSGLGSAINNAVSRVGAPLISAVIFVAISASFYTALASRVEGLDPASPEVRAQIQPLNPPAAGVPPNQAMAAREASTDAFHLAMLVSAGLLLAGAAINGFGLRDQPAAEVGEPVAADNPAGSPA